MPAVAATLGHHLHLGSSGAIEVGSLIRRSDVKFLNTVYWRGHYAGGSAAPGRAGNCCYSYITINDTAAWVAREAGRVCVLSPVHIAGIVASVQLEGVLILVRAGDTAVRSNARLKGYESADVPAKTRQRCQSDASNGVTDGGVGSLQLGACYGLDLHGFNL